MTLAPDPLIASYLDGTLSATEHAALGLWLKAAPENAQCFAQAMLLHDRLRGELVAAATMTTKTLPTKRVSANLHPYRRVRPIAALAGGFIMAAVLIAVLWKGLGETSVSAAVVELNRIIAANADPTDRTYQITVEEVALPEPRGQRSEPAERSRPPKPPLDGAVLHVRGGGQFVLIRTTPEELPFVTGSNGRTSWAVRPDGPVRISRDLMRFNRDVPGHEHSMPLINIQEGLEHLRAAYEIQLLPSNGTDTDEEPRRVIEAVKKRGYRGPKRVEITYATGSGLIQQMRFIDMPYGPERLTLQLSLIEKRRLSDDFFDHTSHHDPDRAVEFEE